MKGFYQTVQELHDDFENEWQKEVKKPYHLRKGQEAFNFLSDHFESVAERIIGTSADPFYFDERLDLFWQRVIEIDSQIDHECKGK